MKKLYVVIALSIIGLLGYSQGGQYKFYFDDDAKMETDTFALTIKADFNHTDYYNLDSLVVDLYKIKSVKNKVYNQQIFSQDIVPINCTPIFRGETIDVYGNTIQKITLKSLTSASFGFDVTYSLANVTTFKQFADCPYAITSKQPLPDSVKESLKETVLIQSSADTIVKLAKLITSGCVNTAQMVENMVKWMNVNLSYDFTFNHDEQDAISVINNKTALCEGYSNLMCAMLRSLGIASRKVDGFMTKAPIHYGIKTNQFTEISTDGAHSWVEVYYPSINSWVSTEPQSNPNFIYPNYIVFNSGVSALIKSYMVYSHYPIAKGNDQVTIGSNTSDTVYCHNTISTKSEVYPTGVSISPIMTLFTTEGTDCFDTTTIQNPTTVSIETPELVKIYPNPATTVLNVDFSSLEDGNALIKIVNQLGTPLYEKSIILSNNHIESIPVTGFLSGVYYVIVQTAGATRTVAFSVIN